MTKGAYIVMDENKKMVIELLIYVGILILVFTLGCGIITGCLWVLIRAFKA